VADGLERAISRGDRAELEPVVIEALAPLYVLLGIEATELLAERLVILEQVPTGETELQPTGRVLPDGREELREVPVYRERCRPNPRARAVLDLAKLLGVDAVQQGTTPRSSTQETGADAEMEAHWRHMAEILERTGPEERG